MLEFKTKVQAVLRADANLLASLNSIPGSSKPAVYLNHLSQFSRVLYPAISLFIENAGSDPTVLFAEDFILQVDVWTDETASAPNVVSGLTGAHAIYRRVKSLLHRGHLNGTLSNPSVYRLSTCTEIAGSMAEGFDEEQRLHQITTRFRVNLIPAGAVEALPT